MGASSANEESSRDRTDLQGGRNDIIVSLAVIVIPMVIMTGVLLGLIYHYQVKSFSDLPGVPNALPKDSSAFIIEFSATRLMTVASWTSTVSTHLPSFAMALFSYRVARNILQASKEKKAENLPTPYQLSIVIGVLSGSMKSLRSWYKYLGWNKRERDNGLVKGSIIWFVSVLVLGYLIVLADTWLHLSTSTIIILQTVPSTSPISSFGRGFFDGCGNSIYPCSVSPGNHGIGLFNSSEGFQTLAKTSSRNLVQPFLHNNQSYVLITDARVPSDTDYQAQTTAVKTQCRLITHECGADLGTAGSTPFNCSVGFSGDLSSDDASVISNPSWHLAGVEFFQDSGLSQNFSALDASEIAFTSANPVYIGAYGLVLGITAGGDSLLLNSTEFILTETQGLGFLLGCEMTAYDLEFVWYNGTVMVQQMTLSNTSVVSQLTAPFVTQVANLLPLAQSAIGEDTPNAFLETWTSGFSFMVLALSAGNMSPRANIREETHKSMLVTRVQKAPMATLVFLNLLYAIVGIFLALIAAKARPGETKSVQGRLNVTGLAAKCFEIEATYERPVKEIEDLFAEKEMGARDGRCLKVAIVESDGGGWTYDLIRKNVVTAVPVVLRPKV